MAGEIRPRWGVNPKADAESAADWLAGNRHPLSLLHWLA